MTREDIIWLSIERNIQSWFCDSKITDNAVNSVTPMLEDALQRLESNPEKYYNKEEDFAFSKAQNRLYEDFGYSLKEMIDDINHLRNAYTGKRLFYDSLYYIVEYWHKELNKC